MLVEYEISPKKEMRYSITQLQTRYQLFHMGLGLVGILIVPQETREFSKWITFNNSTSTMKQ